MAEDKKCYKPKNFTVIRAIQLEVGNEDDVNCGNIIIIIIIIIMTVFFIEMKCFLIQKKFFLVLINFFLS